MLCPSQPRKGFVAEPKMMGLMGEMLGGGFGRLQLEAPAWKVSLLLQAHATRSSKARSSHGQAKPHFGNSCASLLRPQQTKVAQRERKRKEEKEELFKILAGVQNLEETCPEIDARWGDQLSLS